MSDIRNPATWRHYVTVPLDRDWNVTADVPYRIVQQVGSADPSTRTVTVTYLFPSYTSAGTEILKYVLNYFVPPVRTRNGLTNIIPVRNNARLPGNSTLKARKVTWQYHDPTKPIDPYTGDMHNKTASAIASEGIAGLTWPTYGRIIEVSVTYDNGLPDIDPNDPWTWLDIRASVAGEYITKGGQKATWGSPGGTAVADALPEIHTLYPEIEWTVIWEHLPKNAFEATLKPMLTLGQGKTNLSEMDIFFDAPQDSILFVGYELEEEGVTDDGPDPEEIPLTIEMKFLEKRIANGPSLGASFFDHQYQFNSEAGEWQLLYVNGELQYQRYNLNKFFEYPEEGA